ncbi:MAG: tetratricopeptide repeat protein, partial [Candidatus Sulfotelmatobacter sp.]
LLYNQATHFAFLNFDDDMYVTQNPHVIAGLTWSTFTWAMSSTYGNWHPVTWLSHALDCQMFALNPTGHHFTNIILHAINVVLLFLLLLRGTRRMGASLLIASLFAVHPLNVESVAWIAERKNVLSTMFFFLTIGAYGWYSLRARWWRYLVVCLFFILGLASKSMLVTLPFVLLLLDYWPLGRMRGPSAPSLLKSSRTSFGKLLLEKLPLMAVALAASVLTVLTQQEGGAVASLQRFPLNVRLENAIYVYAAYVWKFFWPVRLAPLYPHPGASLAAWKITLAAVFLAAVSLLVFQFRSHSYLVAGWLFFLGTLVPVIGLVQVGSQAMADRYAYLPCLGIFIMAAMGASDLADFKKSGLAVRVAVSACILLALSAVSYRQIGYWNNSVTLWSHALSVTDNNGGAEDGLGAALVQQGLADEAYPHFQRAAAIFPDDAVSRAYIGAYLQLHNRLREAIQEDEISVQLPATPLLHAFVYANLGAAYGQLGNQIGAKENFDHAVRLDPNLPNAWRGLGDLALEQGKFDEAIQDFSQAVVLQPAGETYLHLGRALAAANRQPEALAAYRQALKLSPDLAKADQIANAPSQKLR